MYSLFSLQFIFLIQFVLCVSIAVLTLFVFFNDMAKAHNGNTRLDVEVKDC